MKRFLTVLCVIALLLCVGCNIGKRNSGYTAKGEFIVTNGGISGSDVNNTDIAASVNILPTIRSIVKSDELLNSIYSSLNLDISYTNFKEAVSIEQTEVRSLIFHVVVKADSQETADEILECIQEKLPVYIENKLPGVEISW